MGETNEMPKSLAALLADLDREGIHDHRRYRMVRRYLNFRAREKNIPLTGSFELTPLCNLDCKMCYVHLNREQMQGAELLDTDTWKNIIKQAVDNGMMYARLTGGECLTHPGFREIYLYLQSLGVETAVLTNGILVDEDLIAFFRENPPSAIQITLYGSDEDAYERVTGRRVFAKVWNNLLRLQEEGLPLSVVVTPNAFMEDGEEIVKLLHTAGMKFQINSGIMAPRKETGRFKSDASLDTYIRMMKLKSLLEGRNVTLECDEDSLPDPGGSGEAQKGVRCGAGRSCFSVAWDGIMRPCNTFPLIAEDVLTLGFAECWKRINAQVKEFPLPAECEGCTYKKSCKHCVAEHASDTAVGHASPAICIWAKRLVAEGLIKL